MSKRSEMAAMMRKANEAADAGRVKEAHDLWARAASMDPSRMVPRESDRPTPPLSRNGR